MKHGIVKFWICKECAKEYLDRPMVCSKCNSLEFELKYGGMVTGAEELEKLIETYKFKDDEADRDYKKTIKPDKKPNKEPNDEPEKNKRTRM